MGVRGVGGYQRGCRRRLNSAAPLPLACQRGGRRTGKLTVPPEHAVDLDSGAVIAAEVHPADQGDTTTNATRLPKCLIRVELNGFEKQGHAKIKHA